MKKFLICFLLPLYISGEIQVISQDIQAGISSVKTNSKFIPLYEKFELTFQAQGNWDNPFDPEQVAIDCEVYTPGGDSFSIPAFYFQDYHRVQTAKGEHLEPYGKTCWKVRLTPVTPGTYSYKLKMKNGKQVFETGKSSFTATANSNKPGFVKVSENNPYYFEHDNGDPYFVIGENMNVSDIPSLNKLLTNLSRAGGNFIRTWWCSGAMTLESRVTDHPDQGLGKISQDAAWLIDYQIDLAEKLDVTIMACFETQQYLRTNKWWDSFTYNVNNGGPVKTPGEYFSNEEAAKYFKRRLRYIVARWSYSTSIFAWQFWNEVNSANNFDGKEAAEWHREMAHYLREADPYNHIILTNFGHLDGRQLIDSQPEMEVISTNSYSCRDMGRISYWAADFMTSRYEKPYLLTEYGLGHQGGWAKNDPKGIMVHNGLWGAAIGGAAGSALPWGWSNWVDAQNLYPYFEAFNKTFREIPFHEFTWKSVEVERFVFSDLNKNPYYTNVFFEGFPRNYSFEVCPDPNPDVFRITPDGKVENQECFNAMLRTGGVSAGFDPDEHDDFSGVHASGSRQTLLINMPVAGQLIVHVPEIIGNNSNPVLSVAINKKEVLNKSLRHDDPGEVWAYFSSFPVNLTAGNHEITIANAQKSTENPWQNTLFTAYEITNFRLLEGPDLDYMGLQCNDHIFIWLRNPDFTWMFDRLGRETVKQPEGILSLNNVTRGKYTVVWRDTITGKVIKRDVVSTNDSRLELESPPVDKSVVAHLVRISNIAN